MLEPDAREAGMTLIELMVVVLIIGILMAISIPTFAAQRAKAEDRGVEATLHAGMVAARVRFTEGQTYAGLTPAALQADEPAVRFVGGATAVAGPREVSMRAGDSGNQSWVLLVSQSASGSCFAALHWADEAARYQLTTAPSCAADDFDPTSGSWGNSW